MNGAPTAPWEGVAEASAPPCADLVIACRAVDNPWRNRGVAGDEPMMSVEQARLLHAQCTPSGTRWVWTGGGHPGDNHDAPWKHIHVVLAAVDHAPCGPHRLHTVGTRADLRGRRLSTVCTAPTTVTDRDSIQVLQTQGCGPTRPGGTT